jgi:DNA mismatch endonuclease, patch repair protein
MDRVSAKTRSRMMSRIRGKNTKPELLVRRYFHSAGLRYCLHVPSLPGKPDLVFVRRRTCVFVHGCFWHGCQKCADGRRKPKSNRAYWLPKIRRNKRRDRLHTLQLRADGWKVFTIWECEVADARILERLRKKILRV